MNMMKEMNDRGWVRQKGVTLIELLVAVTISIIAVSGMLAAMANTLGTGGQTIKMTRMTQEMRTTMQLMTRELRRANYHSGFLDCYGNTGCLSSITGLGNVTTKIKSIGINDSADCIWFWYQRPGATATLGSWRVAGFRRKVDGDNIGRIQMTTGSTSATPCASASEAEWVGSTGKGADITDPNFIDVLSFTIVNESPTAEIINSNNDTQNVQRIRLTITSKLKADGSVPGFVQNNANATRTLTELIQVRNHFTAVASP